MIARDKLNVIIPLYNPHAGWEDHFVDHLSELENELKDSEFKVILVNDGSTIHLAGIDRITDRFGYLQYYSYPDNKGKGYAIRYGIGISDADYYVYTDIDFPFGCKIILQTYQLLKSSGVNIVIGTRDLSYFSKLPPGRRLYSFLLKEINYFITGFKIKDTQAGLKGLDNRAKKVLAATNINTFLFELEFLKNSLRQGLTFELINVRCRPGIKFTNFRFKTLFKETIGLLKMIFN